VVCNINESTKKLDQDLVDIHNGTGRVLDSIMKTSNDIDDFEDRVEDLALKLGNYLSMDEKSHLIQSTHDRLQNRGAKITLKQVESLIDESEIQRIRARFQGGFEINAELDVYDYVASVAAGLVAALVDFLVVRIPSDMTYLGNHMQEGSPLTKFMHSRSISSDNWLAQYFKTSYDKVAGIDIEGFSPKTHRLQTFGHDPLVGLVIGAIDIMRGGLTGISKDGSVQIISGIDSVTYNPLKAIVWQIMHIFSDAPTKMGVPALGWTALQLFNVGSYGVKDRTVGELARFMYLKGYDSRHFLTMAASTAAAEIVLRGYFAIRQKLDQNYSDQVLILGEQAGTTSFGGNPRFVSMALIAHGIAAGANAGKIGIYHGNPLALNYVQWIKYIDSFRAWIKIKMRAPSMKLAGMASGNLKLIEQGWLNIDCSDEKFPSLIVK